MKIDIQKGDILEVLKSVESNSVDALLSDPPYGIGFMGEQWDRTVPSVKVWKEILRVLKPGAPLLAFGGTRTFHRQCVNIEDAGFEIRDCLMWLYGQGFPKSHNGVWGGNALKPAWEPITLARKPLGGTMANNVATWGVGGLAIDACRIGTESTIRPNGPSWFASGSRGTGGSAEGRWPANVIFDEEAGALLDEQSDELKSRGNKGVSISTKSVQSFSLGEYGSRSNGSEYTYDKSGGASRFFYCAKVSQKERNFGCFELDNDHPTMKPIALTEYLAKLILPPNAGRLLVPYSGVGSEIIGAMKAGWTDILGIEIWADYIEIANARIEAHQRKQSK